LACIGPARPQGKDRVGEQRFSRKNLFYAAKMEKCPVQKWRSVFGLKEPSGTQQGALASRIRRFSDWPLIVKFSVAPAFALGLLLVLVTIEIATLREVRDDTRHIVAVDMRASTQLAGIGAQFTRADADLSRLLNIAATNPGAADIPARTAAIKKALAGVGRDLAAFRNTDVGRANRAGLDAVLRDVDKYSQAVDVVTAMLGVDFASAASMLESFHGYSQQVTGKIGQIAERGISESNRRAEAMSGRVEGTTAIFTTLALVAVPCIGIASFLVALATVRSIRGIADATSRLAAADYDIDISALHRRDELGAVVAALDTFRANAIEATRLQAEREEQRRLARESERRRVEESEQAERTLRERDEHNRNLALEQKRAMRRTLAQEFEGSISAVIESASLSAERLLSNAEQLKARAEQTRKESTLLDTESGEMAQSMKAAAAAADELMTSFSEIGRQVHSSHQAASTALQEAEKARRRGAVLAEEAEAIETVVGTISRIASQTNLLALNATIEASRAGEAGQGFAVVAGEVKSLAGQTGSATNQVRDQINGIQTSAKEVVDATRTINTMLEQLNSIASNVAGSVQQQVRAGTEITGTVVSALHKTEQLVSASGHIRLSADQNSHAANDMRLAVCDLQNQFQRLRDDAQKFLDHILAA